MKSILTRTGILIIITFVIVLVGGAWAYQRYAISKSQLSISNENKGYFEIKQAGLKFKITDDIKDLTYSIKTDAVNGAKYISFSTQQLQNKGGIHCSAQETALSPLGELDVWQQDPATPGGFANYTYLIKSNNFYVTYHTPQATCSDIKAVQDLQTKQLHSLSDALKTMIKTGTITQIQNSNNLEQNGNLKSKPFTNFQNIVNSLKNQGVKVPIMLPKELPQNYLKDYEHGDLAFYGSVTTENYYYGVTMGPKECDLVGTPPCSYEESEFFADKRALDYILEESGRDSEGNSQLEKISLNSGVQAYYEPVTCGANCTPYPVIHWFYNGIHYGIGINVTKQELTNLANSAINNKQ